MISLYFEDLRLSFKTNGLFCGAQGLIISILEQKFISILPFLATFVFEVIRNFATHPYTVCILGTLVGVLSCKFCSSDCFKKSF